MCYYCKQTQNTQEFGQKIVTTLRFSWSVPRCIMWICERKNGVTSTKFLFLSYIAELDSFESFLLSSDMFLQVSNAKIMKFY